MEEKNDILFSYVIRICSDHHEVLTTADVYQSNDVIHVTDAVSMPMK